MYKKYGSICESKRESGFDWSTFQLTAVILTGFGLIVDITFSFPDHRAVVHLKEKNLQMLGPWGRPGVCQGEAR